MNNKRYILLASLLAAIVLLLATIVGFMIGNRSSEDGPSETTSSQLESEKDTLFAKAEREWSKYSYSDQRAMCAVYVLDPASVLEGVPERELFEEFLDEKCSLSS